MKSYVEAMEAALSPESAERLKKIYAPTEVAVPPGDVARGLCVTPDGEIRIYGPAGRKHPNDEGELVYISSRDAGLSWRQVRVGSTDMLCAASYNPQSGRFIGVHPNEFRRGKNAVCGLDGTYAVLSDKGYDDTDLRFVKLSDRFVHVLKRPIYVESLCRWFIVGEGELREKSRNIFVYSSDDDGESWREQILDHAPAHEAKPPHKSARWQNYSAEPTLVEVDKEHLLIIVRTSQDYHYMHESTDGGMSWSAPAPSPFHATRTMPVLHRLSDGRVVLFWCNTQPLPEIDKEDVFPPLDEDEKSGKWEDVFTNRDANHLAISDDGCKTFVGFRELFLNTIRNNADFRSIGGTDSRDKSVHQGEILELPFGKLLVAFGQNAASRRAVILDIDWLYERGRSEDFRLGIGSLSTQMYVKSNLGGLRHFSGHCAYNRTNGAMLVPDPDGSFEEVLQICYSDDPRLVCGKQGAVWNFPAEVRGSVTVRLRVVGSGVRLALLDRWMNPTDVYAGDYAFTYADIEDCRCGWCDVRIEFDTEKSAARLLVNGEHRCDLPIGDAAPMGLSYLHMQTLADSRDYDGTLIKHLRAE